MSFALFHFSHTHCVYVPVSVWWQCCDTWFNKSPFSIDRWLCTKRIQEWLVDLSGHACQGFRDSGHGRYMQMPVQAIVDDDLCALWDTYQQNPTTHLDKRGFHLLRLVVALLLCCEMLWSETYTNVCWKTQLCPCYRNNQFPRFVVLEDGRKVIGGFHSKTTNFCKICRPTIFNFPENGYMGEIRAGDFNGTIQKI